jgi:ABC-type transport system involved in multi-copper enzyme maturation permease subunit
MSNKVARRCMDGTYDFLSLLVGVMVLVPFLIVIPIICLVGAILSLSRTSPSFNQTGYLLGQKIAGTVMSLPENESRRRLTSKEEQIPHSECRQILTS